MENNFNVRLCEYLSKVSCKGTCTCGRSSRTWPDPIPFVKTVYVGPFLITWEPRKAALFFIIVLKRSNFFFFFPANCFWLSLTRASYVHSLPKVELKGVWNLTFDEGLFEVREIIQLAAHTFTHAMTAFKLWPQVTISSLGIV